MLRSASPSEAAPNSGGSSWGSDLPNPIRATNSFAYVKLGSGCPPPKSSCIQQVIHKSKANHNWHSEYLKLSLALINKRIRPLVYSSVKSFLVPQAHPQIYSLHMLHQPHVVHHNSITSKKFMIRFWDEELRIFYITV